MKTNKNLQVVGLISLIIMNVLVFKIVLDKNLDLIEVPVANVTIQPRSKVVKSMITYVQLPRLLVNENVAINEKDILDKYTEIEGKIPKGSLLFKEMLFDEESLPDYPALKLKEGQSAFSLSTDLLKSSGNSFVSNQKVDLYVTIAEKKEKPVSDLLLKDVRILNIKDRKGYRMEEEKSSKVPSVINLAIRDDQMEILRIASKLGTIDLYATTSAGDEESVMNEECKILPLLSDE